MYCSLAVAWGYYDQAHFIREFEEFGGFTPGRSLQFLAAQAAYNPKKMNESKIENRIDYIELPVTKMEETKQFYGTVFGWKFEDYGPNYTSFSDGRMDGGFTTGRPAPAKDLLLVIYARDLTAAEQKVKAAGGTIVKSTFSFPGGRRFHFSDPNGNELAIWSDIEK